MNEHLQCIAEMMQFSLKTSTNHQLIGYNAKN